MWISIAWRGRSLCVDRKIFALSAYRMLKDGAEVTKRTKQEYHPRFADKQEYIAFMDSFNKVEEADIE